MAVSDKLAQIQQVEADLDAHKDTCWQCQVAGPNGTRPPLLLCYTGREFVKRIDAFHCEMPAVVDVPAGAKVIYQGSQRDAHGEYVLDGRCECDDDCYGRYRLVAADGRVLTHVGRQSFYPVEED